MARCFVVVAAVVALAATACSTTAANAPPTDDVVILDAEGLLPFPIGAPPEPMIEEISETLGGPDRDSSWIGADSPYGLCPGDAMRAVGWGSLFVFFVRDGEGDGAETFHSWTYGFDFQTGDQGDPRRLGLVTARGIGLGSTRAEVMATHQAEVEFSEELAAEIWSFSIGGGADPHIRGIFSGPEDDAVVTFIERVPGCQL